MDIKAIITIDPDTLSGTPVFTGTRVPVESLFDHLEAGVPLDEFRKIFLLLTENKQLPYWKQPANF